MLAGKETTVDIYDDSLRLEVEMINSDSLVPLLILLVASRRTHHSMGPQ